MFVFFSFFRIVSRARVHTEYECLLFINKCISQWRKSTKQNKTKHQATLWKLGTSFKKLSTHFWLTVVRISMDILCFASFGIFYVLVYYVRRITKIWQIETKLQCCEFWLVRLWCRVEYCQCSMDEIKLIVLHHWHVTPLASTPSQKVNI